jgi:predicted ATPase
MQRDSPRPRAVTPELVLVSGYSCIGKSSVMHELHKVVVPPRGLFASGKFDRSTGTLNTRIAQIALRFDRWGRLKK